jgi:hypothetical protein
MYPGRGLLKPSAALIYANGIGDHLLTLPTVRALSAHFGGRLRLISFFEAKDGIISAALIPHRGAPALIPHRGAP